MLNQVTAFGKTGSSTLSFWGFIVLIVHICRTQHDKLIHGLCNDQIGIGSISVSLYI